MPKTDTAPAPKTQKPKAKSTDVAVLNKKDMLTTIVDMAKVSPKDAKAVVDAMLENGNAKVSHGSGVIISLRAA